MLRKGKTKATLESSVDAALLAVEIYNKPRTAFRSEGFIALMIMAWTRLFHACFHASIGDRYYYKKAGKYVVVDGERKAWELNTCIVKYGRLLSPVEKNLQFFIGLRNKIEHRHIEKREVDVLIFGECQALLYNYETMLINMFGAQYALNEALVYSLQFSYLRTHGQKDANKAVLSRDLADVVGYIRKYRAGLDDDVFDSQEYSIKLIQIPRISNTNRFDAAIEFVRWDELNESDKTAYEQIAAIVKDKRVVVSAANVKRLKPSEVVRKVNALLPAVHLTQNLHTVIYKLFGVRPPNGAEDPFNTNAEFCLYDETHGDYVFQDAWVELLVHFFQAGHYTPDQLREKQRAGERFDVEKYRV